MAWAPRRELEPRTGLKPNSEQTSAMICPSPLGAGEHGAAPVPGREFWCNHGTRNMRLCQKTQMCAGPWRPVETGVIHDAKAQRVPQIARMSQASGLPGFLRRILATARQRSQILHFVQPARESGEHAPAAPRRASSVRRVRFAAGAFVQRHQPRGQFLDGLRLSRGASAWRTPPGWPPPSAAPSAVASVTTSALKISAAICRQTALCGRRR